MTDREAMQAALNELLAEQETEMERPGMQAISDWQNMLLTVNDRGKVNQLRDWIAHIEAENATLRAQNKRLQRELTESILEAALAKPEWRDIAALDNDRSFTYVALIKQTVDADENGLNTRREFISWQNLPDNKEKSNARPN